MIFLQIFFYSNSIFEGAKIPKEYRPYAVIGTNAVNVLMTFVAVSLLDFNVISCQLPSKYCGLLL